MAQPNAPHGLHVEFYIDSEKSEYRSEEAGRPIHIDSEFVKILIPGDNKTEIVRVASQADKDRFPVEYARFTNGAKAQEQAVGTPLAAWPAMSRSLVKDLAYLNIHTVEQLATLSDTGKQAFGMGANEWSAKAQAFIKAAEGTAHAEKLAVQTLEQQREIDALKAQIAELATRMPEKRPPGRPPAAREGE